jgi:hypothetical protein
MLVEIPNDTLVIALARALLQAGLVANKFDRQTGILTTRQIDPRPIPLPCPTAKAP